MANPFKVALLGECMIEFSPAKDGLYRQSCAGDTFNSAVYLARQFTPDIAVSYITGLGEDAWSHRIRDALMAENIADVAIITVADKTPGLYVIENDDEGERSFQYWRNDSAARSMFKSWTVEQITKCMEEFDLIYFSGISLGILDHLQRNKLLQAVEALKGKILFAFDPNFRAALWPDRDVCRSVFERVAAIVDIALVTLDDHQALWPENDSKKAGQRWLKNGAREVVIKNGAKTCLIMTQDQCVSALPLEFLKPKDTTGAGDSFAAGYLGMRSLGYDGLAAANVAHAIAGQVIMHPGGVIDQTVWHKVPWEPET